LLNHCRLTLGSETTKSDVHYYYKARILVRVFARALSRHSRARLPSPLRHPRGRRYIELSREKLFSREEDKERKERASAIVCSDVGRRRSSSAQRASGSSR
jgi:hypothetical protein